MKCKMPWSLRKSFVLITGVLLVQVYNGRTGFLPLSAPSCFLVDIDLHYNASRVGHIDLHQLEINYNKSIFVHHVRKGFPDLVKDSCKNVKVRFENVDLKQQLSLEEIILGATFSYEFKDGKKEDLSDRKLLRCINATQKKHDEYLRKFNWLSSVPPLQGKDGKAVKAHAAEYGRNLRHCCHDKVDDICCPEGAVLIDKSSCECAPGNYYDPDAPFLCHLCPNDTYQPKRNMDHCELCSEGEMTLKIGSASCIPVIECNAEVIWTVQGTFTWDATRVGRTASHRCPYGPTNVTLTRACDLKSSSSASWEKFDSSTCDPSKHTETLLSLSKTPIMESNVNNVTELLVSETSASDELDSYDVALATTTIISIVAFNSSQMQVAENVIKVLDNILSVDADVLSGSQLQNRTTSQLINVTERLAENLPLQDGVALLTAANLEMKARVIAPQTNEDVTFLANSGGPNSTSANLPAITISSSAFQEARKQGSDRSISIFYRNKKLFPVFRGKRNLKKQKKDEKQKAKIGDTVLTGKFKNAAIKMLEGAVELKFSDEMISGSYILPRCVFWDFVANDGFGDWSSAGCTYAGTKSGHVTCHCNHMTNFAMLLTADPDRDESDPGHRRALSFISYIGCGVSLLAAILTFGTYVFFREFRRSNAQVILCHLCIALIGLLVSYFVVATREPRTNECLAFSLVTHYFLLATFAWMGVEGINMYLALVKVMSAHVPRFMPKAVLIAWGLPALVVLVTGVVAFEDYSTEESCFLHGLAFYISVFAPAVFVLFVNFIMFALTMYSLSQMGKGVSQENKIQGYQRVKVALGIMVLLGLTWFFGTTAIGSARLTFQYLFCVFNSLQGFAIFWFHCLRQPEVRQCWADFLRGKRGRKRRYTASTTVPPLATNVKKSSSTASPNLRPFCLREKYEMEKKGLACPNQIGTKSV